MAQQPVQDLLNTAVGKNNKDVGYLLQGVVLKDEIAPQQLIDNLFDPKMLLGRIHKLFSNIASADISITVDGLDDHLH